jgi:hypothetical protein
VLHPKWLCLSRDLPIAIPKNPTKKPSLFDVPTTSNGWAKAKTHYRHAAFHAATIFS